MVAYLCCTSFSPPSAKFSCSKSHLGLDFFFAGFHSQISSVFKVPGKKDLYIACADRWQPAYQHLAYEDYAELYQSWFDPEMDKTIPERKKHIPEDGKANTSMSDYVWLPIRFEGDKPVIDWKDEWRIEDYG